MKVQLNKEELWPYYVDWHGYGKPDFDIEVPDELFSRYEKTMGEFFTVLSELKVFLNDT